MYLQRVPSSREDLMGLNTEKYAFDKAVNSSFVYESPLGMDYLLYCMLIALFIQDSKERLCSTFCVHRFFVSIASRKKRNVTEIVKNISKKGARSIDVRYSYFSSKLHFRAL